MLVISFPSGSIDSCIVCSSSCSLEQVRQKVVEVGSLTDFYLLQNGKLLRKGDVLKEGVVYAIPRLPGGKGGFGSMLRAIGAQIEKTTNREACRDLSGRRLRDINEEKRLKNWITQQAEREHEADERKRKKLERLGVQPKHEFHDDSYEKARSSLSQNLSDAVEQGFQADSSRNLNSKRKLQGQDSQGVKAKKKKTCLLWLDSELSSASDTGDSDGAESSSSIPNDVSSDNVSQSSGTTLKNNSSPDVETKV